MADDWSVDWRLTKNKPDGGKRCSNKFCIGAIACRGSKFGAIRFGVSGVSFGAAELQQQGCSSSAAGQERCSRSTGVKRCRRRAEVWCRSRADEESRTIVEWDCTIEVCLGLWEFWLGILWLLELSAGNFGLGAAGIERLAAQATPVAARRGKRA